MPKALESELLYLNFSTQEQLDAQYETNRYLVDPEGLLASRKAGTSRALSQLTHRLNLPYGESDIETYDYFRGKGDDSPLFVFLHGGYWSTPFLVKELYSWVALGLQAHGFATAVIDYGSAPECTIPEQVAQCRSAIANLVGNSDALGFDETKIYAAGHSAGGHLACMLALTKWRKKYGLSDDLIKGVCSISGLYDLRPFPHTWLAPKLNLDPDQIRQNSPIFLADRRLCPMLLAFGSEETSEFHRQAEDMGKVCEKVGSPYDLLSIDSALHNSAIDGLMSPDSQITRAIVQHAAQSFPAEIT